MSENRRSASMRVLTTGLFLAGLLASMLMSQVQAASTRGNGLPGVQLQVYNQLDVVINEVAWSGNVSNSKGEWIELYNPGEVDIELTGWKLVADDGEPSINLTKKIEAFLWSLSVWLVSGFCTEKT